MEGPRTTQAEGVDVRYVRAGEGPAVVLVHGLGVSLAVWWENIASLAERNTVYALDLPGHGDSDKHPDLSYDAVTGAHFLRRFMDAVGIGKATLVGNSAGGLIAGICALTYPERVSGLVMVDSAGLGRPLSWFLRLASLPLAGDLMLIPNVRNYRNMIRSVFYEPRPLDENLVKELVRTRNSPASKRAVPEAMRSSVNIWGLKRDSMLLDSLKSFDRPLLVVWGREDRIIPVSHAHRAAKLLPKSSVHIIARCGHWPQLERSVEFNPVVAAFLKEASSAEPPAA